MFLPSLKRWFTQRSPGSRHKLSVIRRAKSSVEPLEARHLMAAVLFDGFESGAPSPQWTECFSCDNLKVVNNAAHTGEYSAKITYSRDEDDAHLDLHTRLLSQTGEVYVEFWQMFPTGFDGRNLKQSALVHNEGSVTDGSVMLAAWTTTEHQLQTTFYEEDRAAWTNFTIPAGVWFKTSYHIKYNTPGLSNGTYRLWVDDRLLTSRDDVNYRDSFVAADIIWVGGNYSGKGVDPIPFERYIDDIRIETTAPSMVMPLITGADVGVREGDTGQSALIFTVNLSQPAATTVTVDFATRPHRPDPGVDYHDVAGTLVFPPGVTMATVSVPIFGDQEVEYNEFILLDLTNPTGAALERSTIWGTIQNDDLPVLRSRDVGAGEGDSGMRNLDFQLELTAPVETPVTVEYATRPHGATPGVDYISRSGTVTFLPGETTKLVSVPIVGDSVVEMNEFVLLDLTRVSGAVVERSTIWGTIQDDDDPSTGVDDAGATRGTAAPVGMIPSQLSVTGAIETAKDVDLYRIEVAARQRVWFDIDTPENGAPGLGSYLRLFDSNGRELASNNDAQAPDEAPTPRGERHLTSYFDSYIGYTFRKGGVFYVGVSNWQNTSYNIGTGAVRLKASPSHLTGSYQLTMTTAGLPTRGYDIEISMMNLTDRQREVIAAAEARWESLIVGDVPAAKWQGRRVDDLRVDVSVAPIDGPGGVLAQAGPDSYRLGSLLPIHGVLRLDAADIAQLEREGTLLSTVTHELGHVLGFGTLWQRKGLLVNAGTSDPRYVGRAATAEYSTWVGGVASSIPVEASGGVGTQDAHWRESEFDAELMTGLVEPTGVSMPLSRVTVASMADLGYIVNLSAADPFTIRPVSFPYPSAVVVGEAAAASRADAVFANGYEGDKVRIAPALRFENATKLTGTVLGTASNGAALAESEDAESSTKLKWRSRVDAAMHWFANSRSIAWRPLELRSAGAQENF